MQSLAMFENSIFNASSWFWVLLIFVNCLWNSLSCVNINGGGRLWYSISLGMKSESESIQCFSVGIFQIIRVHNKSCTQKETSFSSTETSLSLSDEFDVLNLSCTLWFVPSISDTISLFDFSSFQISQWSLYSPLLYLSRTDFSLFKVTKFSELLIAYRRYWEYNRTAFCLWDASIKR